MTLPRCVEFAAFLATAPLARLVDLWVAESNARGLAAANAAVPPVLERVEIFFGGFDMKRLSHTVELTPRSKLGPRRSGRWA